MKSSVTTRVENIGNKSDKISGEISMVRKYNKSSGDFKHRV